MEISFDDYIKDAKSQLFCNASEEYKSTCITFMYVDEDIDNNLDYFKDCLSRGVSAYLALNLLYYHLLDKPL